MTAKERCTERIVVRVTPSVAERLRAHAAYEGRSVAGALRRIVEEALRDVEGLDPLPYEPPRRKGGARARTHRKG